MTPTDQLQGLTTQQVEQKQAEWGFNEIAKTKKKSWLKKLIAEFGDIMIIILIVAAIFAIISHEVIDGIVILVIVVANAFISFIQQYRAEQALASLQKLVSPQAKVLRNGIVEIIESRLLVPDDIVLLEAGDRVPADGIMLESRNLHAQESILTGESLPVEKKVPEDPNQLNELHKVFMGTEISHGFGKIKITAIGNKTEFGRIAHLTQTTQSDKSPLQKEVHHIGLLVSKIVLVIATVLFLQGLISNPGEYVKSLLFATSVAVAAVPEGLPATITIALALGVQRLAKSKAIVKNLSSAETLGSTSCIISDKTGTLTRNEMTAIKLYLGSQAINVSGVGYLPEGQLDKETNFEILKKLNLVSELCTSTKLTVNPEGKVQVAGDPTEAALIVLAKKIGHQFKIETDSDNSIVHANPFDSERKMMSVLVDRNNGYELLAKGAPEAILANCNYELTSSGDIIELTKERRTEILTTQDQLTQQALRVLALAYRPQSDVENKSETNLTFIGLAGILDPPRSEVKEVVKQAKKAGIQIIVATGDNGSTARAIAEQLGIVTKDTKVYTHQDMECITDEQLIHILRTEKDILFARVTPEDKLRVVRAQQANDHIVAVTGDGVNDAPALKQADIGVAMGITGTDVSKEAANMVLADDQFQTIVKAIAEGRRIYQNLRKIVFYLFSSNIGELVAIIVAILIGLPAPLTAILILLVNVGTDAFPAIALSVDPSDGNELNNHPRPKNSRILAKKPLIQIVTVGIYIGVIVFLSYLSVLYTNNWQLDNPLVMKKAITAAFISLIMIQAFNALNASFLDEPIINYLKSPGKSILTLIKEKWLLLINAFLTIAIAYLLTIIPTTQKVLGVTELSGKLWLTISIISVSIIFFAEIYKILVFKPNK